MLSEVRVVDRRGRTGLAGAAQQDDPGAGVVTAGQPLVVHVVLACTPEGRPRRKALLSAWRAVVVAREWTERGWTVQVVRLQQEAEQ